MYPLSNCIPSTISKLVSADFDSSTLTTPSFPTVSRISETSSPIAGSLPEMVATSFIPDLPLTGLDIFASFSTTASHARSIPRLICIGFEPAATFLAPSWKMA